MNANNELEIMEIEATEKIQNAADRMRDLIGLYRMGGIQETVNYCEDAEKISNVINEIVNGYIDKL